jgi:hypothetical protein
MTEGFSFNQDNLENILKEQDEKDRLNNIALFSSCPYGFWEYLKYKNPKFFNEDRKYLKLYAACLMLVELGYVWNLIISIPRRTGKSYTMNEFTAFTIGRNPEKSNTRNSFSKSKSEEFSIKIRGFIQEEVYQKLFPKIKLLTKNISKWSITLAKQHSFMAAGVDGGSTGSGTDNILCGDDLVKSPEQAISPAFKRSLDMFIETVYESGMEPGSKRVEIGTRAAPDDPIGRVLDEVEKTGVKLIKFDAFEKKITDESIDKFIKKIIKADLQELDEDWVQLVIPALNKNDESNVEGIRPAKWYKKRRELAKLRGTSYLFETVYQQNPIPKEGLLFPKEDLKYFYFEDIDKEVLPEILFIDPAGKGSNNTCGGFCKVKSQEEVYVIDMIYTPEEPKLSKAICVKKILEHKNNLGKISGEGNFGGDIYLEGIEELLGKNDFSISINIKASSENKESKIFIMSDLIKNCFRFPYEFDRDGNRQYEIGGPMDRAIKALTKYLGKINGVFVTNQEDDFADDLVGLLRMLNESTGAFGIGFY